MTTARMCDVSSWQHPDGAAIDWAQVKADGIVGVIVKSTQGVGYTNPHFRADVEGAKAVGLLVGCYHFAQPAQNDVAAEVGHALAAVSGLHLDLGLALDWEDIGGKQPYEVAPWAETWLDQAGQVVPLTPFYVDQSLLATTTGAPWGRPLWIADPSGTYEGPVWMRQTGQGPVPGITGAVDLDTFYGVRGVNPGPVPVGPAPEPTPAPEPVPTPAPPTPQPPVPPQEVTVQVPVLSAANPGPNVVSEPVRAVQAILIGKWHASVGATGIDGRFGPATTDAVRSVQTTAAGAAGPVDGVVGPLTWQYLCND